jgi:tungstate transport system substrate-binding protein
VFAARLILVCALAGACRHADIPLRLGTTTTVEQSGALAIVDSLWHGAPLAKVIGPSGQILRSAAEGDLDLVITHAPALEAKWLGGERAALRCPLVASRFAIVGPAADPAGVASAGSAADAVARVARRRAPFVSRGDSSGTHIKELALWHAARVSPRGERWYIESGASQAATLQIADERGAYALADLPTLAHVEGIALRILFSADTALLNPYTLYVVRQPAEHPGARPFATWAMGVWRDRLAAIRLPDGSPAFVPRAGECAATGRP